MNWNILLTIRKPTNPSQKSVSNYANYIQIETKQRIVDPLFLDESIRSIEPLEAHKSHTVVRTAKSGRQNSNARTATLAGKSIRIACDALSKAFFPLYL